jgi:hypothetical protein
MIEKSKFIIIYLSYKMIIKTPKAINEAEPSKYAITGANRGKH